MKEFMATYFRLNDQFPKEIQVRQKKLHPVMKQFREKGRQALTVDKLNMDGQLYHDPNMTTWQ